MQLQAQACKHKTSVLGQRQRQGPRMQKIGFTEIVKVSPTMYTRTRPPPQFMDRKIKE